MVEDEEDGDEGDASVGEHRCGCFLFGDEDEHADGVDNEVGGDGDDAKCI